METIPHSVSVKVGKVSHWLENEEAVCLHGLGQFSPYELAFAVGLGPTVIFMVLRARSIPVWLPVHAPIGPGREGGVRAGKSPTWGGE